jgi:hypothetical protein
MANRSFSKVQSLNKEVKLIAGSFSIAASGGTATKVSGLGYTVAKSATGEYTITLSDRYPALISAVATVQAATPVDLVAQIDNHDVSAATPIVVLNLNAGATPTEPSAVTVVNFVLVLQNSGLSKV